ncbi:MAG: lysophospholipid acyltransferase family protein [Phycisphaerales bacterium]
MSDTFYRFMCVLGRPVFWVSSVPVVFGAEHIPRRGPCLVAANHTCPFDIPLLMRHTPRLLDFVSNTDVFRNPLVARFYGSLNAFPLDRSRPDAPTVRTILERLERGRAVCIFPEGRFRRGPASVLHGGRIVPGVGRLVELSGASVIPAVVVNAAAYSHPAAWLPLGRTVYGVCFGEAIAPRAEPEDLERDLVDAMRALYAKLLARLPERSRRV